MGACILSSSDPRSVCPSRRFSPAPLLSVLPCTLNLLWFVFLKRIHNLRCLLFLILFLSALFFPSPPRSFLSLFLLSGERPYIVSGSDDCTVRVWDYQTKQCIQVSRHSSRSSTQVSARPLPLTGGGASLSVHELTDADIDTQR